MCMQFSSKHFEKKDEYPSLIISEIMDYWKRWLLKRLKGRASEDHAVINVLTGSKHCSKISKAQLLSYFAMHLGYIEYPWKKSALVWCEILTLFVNTLTAHNKYSRCNVHNFLFSQQVQTPLSQK